MNIRKLIMRTPLKGWYRTRIEVTHLTTLAHKVLVKRK